LEIHNYVMSSKTLNYLPRKKKEKFEYVELYLIANGVKEERKVAVLLSVVGLKTYATLCDMLAQ